MALALAVHGIAQLGISGGTSGPVNTSACNLIVVGQAHQGGSVFLGFADSKGNTYTHKVDPSEPGNGGVVDWYYTYGANVGDAAMTWTTTGTNISSSIVWLCFTGARTLSDPFSSAVFGNSGSGGTPTSSFAPGLITTNAGEVALSLLCNFADADDTDRSINSGFTVSDQTGYTASPGMYTVAGAYKYQTGASEDPTWSWTSGDQQYIRASNITFAAAPSVGSSLILGGSPQL